MAKLLTPDSHAKAIKVNASIISIGKYPVTNFTWILFTIDKEITDFYFTGQEIKLFLNPTDVPIVGVLKITQHNATSILMDCNVDVDILASTGYFFNSFDGSEHADNETLTKKDAIALLKPLAKKLAYPRQEEATEHIGRPGLIDGSDLLKLNNQLDYYIDPALIGFSNSATFLPLATINIPYNQRVFQHSLAFKGNNFSAEFDFFFENIVWSNIDNTNKLLVEIPFNIKSKIFTINNSTAYNENVSLIFKIDYYYVLGNISNDRHIIISYRFQNIDASTAFETIRCFHKTTKFEMFGYPDLSAYSKKTFNYPMIQNLNDNYISTIADLDKTKIMLSEFIFDNTVIGYNNNGRIFDIQKGSTILTPLLFNSMGSDLNTFKSPGFYNFNISAVYGAIQNTPTIVLLPNEILSAVCNLEVQNFNVSNYISVIGQYDPGQIMISQKFTTLIYTNDSDVNQTGRYVECNRYWHETLQIWGNWVEIGNKIHTHNPIDIIETNTKKFVTQDQINLWNTSSGQIGTSNWKSPVATLTDLPAANTQPNPPINGDIRTVLATGIVYEFITNNWIPISINALSNASRTLTGLLDSSTFTKWDYTPFAKLLDTTSDFWVMGNTNSGVYGDSLEYVSNDFFDFVTRTVLLAKKLGEKSIAFGFDNTIVYSDYSIGIGSNVLIDTTNTDCIGIGRNILFTLINSIGIGFGLNIDNTNSIVLGTFNASLNSGGQQLVFAIGDGTSESQRSNLLSITKPGKVIVKGGYSIETKTNDDILLGDGTTISMTAMIDAIPKTPFTVITREEMLDTDPVKTINWLTDFIPDSTTITYQQQHGDLKNVVVQLMVPSPLIINAFAPSLNWAVILAPDAPKLIIDNQSQNAYYIISSVTLQ